MSSSFYSEADRDYIDVYIYIEPYKHFSRECWKRCISLDVVDGNIGELDWEYAESENHSCEYTRKSPPIEVLREYSHRYPEMIAEITRRRLLGS